MKKYIKLFVGKCTKDLQQKKIHIILNQNNFIILNGNIDEIKYLKVHNFVGQLIEKILGTFQLIKYYSLEILKCRELILIYVIYFI